jgi:cytochrome c oxidase assembly protein subunit 15
MNIAAHTTPNRYTKIYLRWLTLTLFLTFDLIVFGAYVRLSDSGLGCPDWPGCYAQATPWHAQTHIALEESLRPDGAVTHFKAWIEMIHRYVATVLGILCITLLGMAIKWRRYLSIGYKLAAFILFWISLQGAFGMWTVTLKLMPVVVTAHLLGGLVLLSLLAWQHIRLTARLMPSIAYDDSPYAVWIKWIWLFLLALIIQIALGGWVSTNYAAMACSTIPLCQGAWIPEMDFAKGFTLWRDLGAVDATGTTGQWLPFSALVAIHWVHRMNAIAVMLIALVVLLKIKRASLFKKYRRGIMVVLTIQILTGISTVIFGYPLLAAVLHTAGAATLVMLTIRLLALMYEMKRHIHHSKILASAQLSHD